MDETAKEAYASFVLSPLAIDDSCKVANQRITRGQALLIADKLANYQMNYFADHAQNQVAEVRQIPGEDGTIILPAMSYTTFNKKWSDNLKRQKEARDAEEAAKKAEAERKAAEAKKAAEQTTATTQQKKEDKQVTETTQKKEASTQATTAAPQKKQKKTKKAK